MVKFYSCLLATAAVLSLGQPTFANDNSRAPTEAELNDLANSNPQAYEIYRQYQVEHAKTYEEFLNWATPSEIADDLGIDLDAQLPVENVGSAIVSIHVNLAAHTITMTSPLGTFSDGAMGARPGYRVPSGCFPPTMLDRNHMSSIYHVRMPNAVFFSGGSALHAGSLNVGSHGCVHLTNEMSAKVYDTVAHYGRANTEICVQ